MKPILTLDNVSKHYGKSQVLQSVSFEVAVGETVVLMGGSGSGKSTILRVASGLERINEGTVQLRDRLVDAPSRNVFVPPEKRHLGMVFQDYALWPHLTSLENVKAALSISGSTADRVASKLLDDVGIGKLARRYPAELSGGQQQRVGLARAMAAGPDLLLLDEPLSGLDVEMRERMRATIRDMVRRSGTTALFVSHDPTDAWRLADTVMVLEAGRIVQQGTPRDLYDTPANPRVARLMGAEGPFTVSSDGADAPASVALGPVDQPVTRVDAHARDTERVAFIRPEGVTLGDTGHRAELRNTFFEAGQWRSRWYLVDVGWEITSINIQRPPEQARLNIAQGHIFLFNKQGKLP